MLNIMQNTDPANATTITDINTGIRVDRTVAGIVTGQNPIFEVIGGPVLVNMFYGIVTTALEAAGLLLHLDMDATSGLDFDLSVDSADFTGDVAGTVYIPPATVAGAITVNANINLCPQWILPIGELDLHASANNTGTIKWSLFYYPLTEGAYVVAHA